MESIAAIDRRARRQVVPASLYTVLDLGEPTPPVVDKLWLDNIVRAEAFMALERRWDPAAGVNNRGHMGGGNKEGDRIDNHRSYRAEEPPEKTSKKKKK